MALLLHSFEVESVRARTVPEAEMGKPVLGLISVKEEAQEVRVKLTAMVAS
jgi:hypothetical protein